MRKVYAPYIFKNGCLVPAEKVEGEGRLFLNPENVLAMPIFNEVLASILNGETWFLLYTKSVAKGQIVTSSGTISLATLLKVFDVKPRIFMTTGTLPGVPRFRAVLPFDTEVGSAEDCHMDMVRTLLLSTESQAKTKWNIYAEAPNDFVIEIRDIVEKDKQSGSSYVHFSLVDGIVYRFHNDEPLSPDDRHGFLSWATPAKLYIVPIIRIRRFASIAEDHAVAHQVDPAHHWTCECCGKVYDPITV